jgi:hypothetical protein
VKTSGIVCAEPDTARDLPGEVPRIRRLEDIASHGQAGRAGLHHLIDIAKDLGRSRQPRAPGDDDRDGAGADDVGHLRDRAGIGHLHDVRAQVGAQRGGVSHQGGISRVGDLRPARIGHDQERQVPRVARRRNGGEVPHLRGLFAAAQVEVNADRVSAEPQGFGDGGHEVFGVRVFRVHRAGGQVDDQRQIREPAMVELPRAALVHDDRVHLAAGELTDQLIEPAGLADYRTVGHRMVERDDQEPVTVPE